ncbi:MAG: RtcB family protein [Candidatus Calescibacterium sp.]|nr:RtcB family protein [Candidatus Calescibacterium sp.]MCX7971659.1 RtcB family protein [bacterium]MDW8195265.1 RtcB family protein [Candidatus Calescibacterium sp.]
MKVEEIQKIEENIYKVYKEGISRIPALVFADEQIIESVISDQSFTQIVNVTSLQGVEYVFIMPDVHWGYGFPIGAVACTNYHEGGIISPGGIGFDINCGVRLLRTNLTSKDLTENLKEKLLDKLFEYVPSGVAAEGDIRLSKSEFKKIVEKGLNWAVENDMASEHEIELVEDRGVKDNVDIQNVSTEAIDRGRTQLGTLGSGNHFLEIQVVDKIYEEKVASVLGLYENQIVVMIHCGSRGFGHQIASDYINLMLKSMDKYGIKVSDKQLACVPAISSEGQRYITAMNAAANFAHLNRQIITHKVRKAFKQVLGSKISVELVYDISHNMATIEDYSINGKKTRLVMHRKGATRALPPYHKSLPDVYKPIGQPVFIPGDMGRYSFVLVGTQRAYELTCGHTCHGAGRVKSRNQMKKEVDYNKLLEFLRNKGISIRASSKATVVEEAPEAYKDASSVVDIVHKVGISLIVARLKPIGVVKG